MVSPGFVNARGLADSPLDAASQFHARIVPPLREAMKRNAVLVVCFDPADHSHRAWRLAAIQDLAREAAPSCRINAVVGELNGASADVLAFLGRSPGVTGQILEVDAISGEKA